MQSFIRAQYVRKQKDSLNIGHILKIIQENVFFLRLYSLIYSVKETCEQIETVAAC